MGMMLSFLLTDASGMDDRTTRLAAYETAGQAAGIDGQALYFEDLVRIAPMDDRVTIPGFLEAIGVSGAVAPGTGAATQGLETSSAAPAPVRWNHLDRKS